MIWKSHSCGWFIVFVRIYFSTSYIEHYRPDRKSMKGCSPRLAVCMDMMRYRNKKYLSKLIRTNLFSLWLMMNWDGHFRSTWFFIFRSITSNLTGRLIIRFINQTIQLKFGKACCILCPNKNWPNWKLYWINRLYKVETYNCDKRPVLMSCSLLEKN